MKLLGFGKPLYERTRDALEGEWARIPSERREWALAIRVHVFRIIACDPRDKDAILRNTQALKLFLTRLENQVQSGEAQP